MKIPYLFVGIRVNPHFMANEQEVLILFINVFFYFQETNAYLWPRFIYHTIIKFDFASDSKLSINNFDCACDSSSVYIQSCRCVYFTISTFYYFTISTFYYFTSLVQNKRPHFQNKYKLE